MKRLLFVLFSSVALILVLSSCGKATNDDTQNTPTMEEPDFTTDNDTPSEPEDPSAEWPETAPLAYGIVDLPQLDPVQPGETIAVMTTNHGDITFRFFPELAPKAVENFLTHADNGYYEGIVFHRIAPGFMIQGGDPTATGMGGESIWGEPFEHEDTPQLHHLRGALSMANSGPDTNGSQFFIVSNNALDEDAIEFLTWAKNEQNAVVGLDDEERLVTIGDFFQPAIIDKYLEEGGALTLDNPFGRYTVFGHVISGMEVVDAISNAPFQEEMRPGEGRPIEDVVIERIVVTTYNG